MIKGQILVYRFNGLHNAKSGVNRYIFSLRDVDVDQPIEFKHAVKDALDEVPPGKGYVLIKWSGKMFIAEKDINNPGLSYIRHEIKWHPLQDKFTI